MPPDRSRRRHRPAAGKARGADDGWIAPGEQVVVLNTGNPPVQPELLG
jgi:hypothetical protein